MAQNSECDTTISGCMPFIHALLKFWYATTNIFTDIIINPERRDQDLPLTFLGPVIIARKYIKI